MPGDLDKLQGSWNVTALEVDGQALAAPLFNGSKIVVAGGKFQSLGMGAEYKGTIAVDETKKPKALDLIFSSGPERGNRNLGIYKLTNARWTICLATRGKQRPVKFATAPGTGFALETLTRDSEGAKPPSSRQAAASSAVRSPASSGEATELEGEWEMMSGVFGGAALDASMVTWCRRTTRGNVTVITAGPETLFRVSFSLDDSKSPRAIDYDNLEGANAGKSQFGIFERAGDTLTVCMAAPKKPRPNGFSSSKGDGRSLTKWRRVKK